MPLENGMELMHKGRLEAFSDGVIAIIITIMVLELKAPQSVEFAGLKDLVPYILSYVLSFVYVAIYWNNHHHLLHAVKQVNGAVLWANMHLLFWLSLIPFVSGWMGQHATAPLPIALYGLVLLMCAIAYFILVRVLIRLHGTDSAIAHAIGTDRKGKISVVLYALGILCAWKPGVSGVIYATVAVMWLVPDRRIEHRVPE